MPSTNGYGSKPVIPYAHILTKEQARHHDSLDEQIMWERHGVVGR